MKKQNDINKLCSYLISKGVTNQLRLQKLLFFIRYEELKSKNIEDSFFANKANFQAWIYGPVNYDSYKSFQNFFWGFDEKDTYILDEKEIKQIDKKYKVFYEKWNSFSTSQLVDKSHKNLSWIKARKGIDSDKPSNNILEENQTFLKFEDEN